MALTMTNRGLFTIANSAISAATDFRVLIFKTTLPTAAAVRDMNFVSDLLAATSEAAAAGYARIDLAGVAIAENDTPDTVTITATAPTTAAIAAGETWLGLAYYIEAGSDAARVLVAVALDMASQVTNGGAIALPAMSFTVTGS